MKKKILLLLALVTLAGSAAQAKLKIGIRAGANMTKANLDGPVSDLFKSSTRPGYFVGPTLELNTGFLGLGFDIAALYENKRLNLDNTMTGASDSQSLHYIDIPLNLRWTLSLGKLGVYAATGPQIAWNVGGKLMQFLLDNNYDINKSTFSWNVGGGINLGKHFRLGYTYNIAIGQTAEQKNIVNTVGTAIDNAKLKSNSHQVHLTYFF